jgi:CelD/BcsL family acetyltransferase involved in cellulose biosynthesis
MGAAVTIDPLADPRWRTLLSSSPEGSVFHHPAWLRLLQTTYRYELCACCIEADDRLVAGLPVATVASRLTGRRLVALPFSDVCPAAVARGAPPYARAALGEALADLQRSRDLPLEIRSPSELAAGASSGERFHHHLVALERDPAAVQARFSRPQALRGVRRALREGLRAEVRTDSAALTRFYRLHMATRRRLGVPTQPRRFIMGLEQLFGEGLGFVLLVHAAGEDAAAAVFLTSQGVLTYKYGASNPRSLAARPNNLLFMEAIRWGCEQGFRTLDLGRTHWGQDGLRSFKLSWGAKERELRYRHLGRASTRDARIGGGLAALIRRSPPFASRLIGEVLYRHAG